MKNIALFFLALIVNIGTWAQDPHFSQYYASPTTVNPAMAGMFSGNMRLSAIYRQQWPQYGQPFVTGTFAVEVKPGQFANDNGNDRMAIGGMFLYDKTPDAVLKSQYAYGMIAYHKTLDAAGHHRLGLGFMTGVNQRTLDVSQLTFGSSFGSGGFQRTGGDVIKYGKSTSFDAHTGFVYSYEDEYKVYCIGGSVFHVLNPKDYFLEDGSKATGTPKRWSANAGFHITTENEISYVGSALFMQQANVNYFMAGALIGVPFGEGGKIYGGAFYRLNESIIPTLNLEYNTFNLGFSYDVLVGRETNIQPKTIEVSASWRWIKDRDLIRCPTVF
ncbi:MAG: hypothetical protein C4330_05105 [Chitinophagaceae bacterium]